YKNEAFSYFCGKLRTPNLEEILPQNNNTIEAVELYETQLKGKRVKGHFDGVLFFSPSGVRGYALDNNFENTHSFCIGPSTAKEVALYTPNFTVAKTPTESQLLLSIKNHNIPHEE
ncbi:MAG: uroporphyrinogen-III synthase, partial [Flavobacteriaceae bacterium]|nr:uroporphyrinogen-III synthase [Flavobacteriaceae bacterium]